MMMKRRLVTIGVTFLPVMFVISDVFAFQFSTKFGVGKHFLSSRGGDDLKSLPCWLFATITPHSDSSSITLLEDEQDNWITNAAETLPNELAFPHRYHEDTTTAEAGELKCSDSDVTIYGSKDELVNDQIEGEIRDMATKTTALDRNLPSDLHFLDHSMVSSGFLDSYQNRELLEKDARSVEVELSIPNGNGVLNSNLDSEDLMNTIPGPRKMIIQQCHEGLSRNRGQNTKSEARNSLTSLEKSTGKICGIAGIQRLKVPLPENDKIRSRLDTRSKAEGRMEQRDSFSAIIETNALNSIVDGSIDNIKDRNVTQKTEVETAYQFAKEPASPLPPFHLPDLGMISSFLKAAVTPAISLNALKQKGDGALIECAIASATKSILHAGKMAALASESFLDIITNGHVLYETQRTVSTTLECIWKEDDVLKSIKTALLSTLAIANTVLRTAATANTTKSTFAAAEEVGQELATTFVALSVVGDRKFRTIVDYTLKLTEQQLAAHREKAAFEAAVTEAEKQCEIEKQRTEREYQAALKHVEEELSRKAEEEKRRIEVEYQATLKRFEEDLMAVKSKPLHLLKENELKLNYHFAREKKMVYKGGN